MSRRPARRFCHGHRLRGVWAACIPDIPTQTRTCVMVSSSSRPREINPLHPSMSREDATVAVATPDHLYTHPCFVSRSVTWHPARYRGRLDIAERTAFLLGVRLVKTVQTNSGPGVSFWRDYLGDRLNISGMRHARTPDTLHAKPRPRQIGCPIVFCAGARAIDTRQRPQQRPGSATPRLHVCARQFGVLPLIALN